MTEDASLFLHGRGEQEHPIPLLPTVGEGVRG